MSLRNTVADNQEQILDLTKQIGEVITYLENAQKERDELHLQATQIITRHEKEIADLKETISELVLLDGLTESNNKQNNGGNNANSTKQSKS